MSQPTPAHSTDAAFTLLVDGVDFGEGPRWHDGKLWYSDFFQQRVYIVSSDGSRETVFELDDRPSGMGWLPNGDLIVVSMTRRKLVRWDGATLSDYADLSAFAGGHCNDMIITENGTAYVGNFGFEFEAGEEFTVGTLIGVHPNGDVFAAAEGMAFANGSVITPDAKTLIVGESFGQGYKAFDIGDDGTLSNERSWAIIEGTAPDGCTQDAEGAIWYSDAIGQQIIRVKEGGEVTHRIPTPQNTYACMLGGDDGLTLFVLTAPGSHPDEVAGKAAGAIYTTPVEVPHAGRP